MLHKAVRKVTKIGSTYASDAIINPITSPTYVASCFEKQSIRRKCGVSYSTELGEYSTIGLIIALEMNNHNNSRSMDNLPLADRNKDNYKPYVHLVKNCIEYQDIQFFSRNLKLKNNDETKVLETTLWPILTNPDHKVPNTEDRSL